MKQAYYTESEAARELGWSVQELRNRVKRHVLGEGDDLMQEAIAALSAADLVVLRILAATSRSTSECTHPQ